MVSLTKVEKDQVAKIESLGLTVTQIKGGHKHNKAEVVHPTSGRRHCITLMKSPGDWLSVRNWEGQIRRFLKTGDPR